MTACQRTVHSTISQRSVKYQLGRISECYLRSKTNPRLTPCNKSTWKCAFKNAAKSSKEWASIAKSMKRWTRLTKGITHWRSKKTCPLSLSTFKTFHRWQPSSRCASISTSGSCKATSTLCSFDSSIHQSTSLSNWLRFDRNCWQSPILQRSRKNFRRVNTQSIFQKTLLSSTTTRSSSLRPWSRLSHRPK